MADKEKNAEQEKKKKRPEGILVVKGDQDAADNAVREGGIDGTFFIESHGNDRDTVAEALRNTLLKDLKREAGVTLRVMKFHPVIEKDKFYSGFVECNFVARDVQTLIYLSLRYGPSAVEVAKPDSVTITRPELQNMAADASAAVQTLVGKILDQMTDEQRTKTLKDGLNLG